MIKPIPVHLVEDVILSHVRFSARSVQNQFARAIVVKECFTVGIATTGTSSISVRVVINGFAGITKKVVLSATNYTARRVQIAKCVACTVRVATKITLPGSVPIAKNTFVGPARSARPASLLCACIVLTDPNTLKEREGVMSVLTITSSRRHILARFVIAEWSLQ